MEEQEQSRQPDPSTWRTRLRQVGFWMVTAGTIGVFAALGVGHAGWLDGFGPEVSLFPAFLAFLGIRLHRAGSGSWSSHDQLVEELLDP